MDIDPLKLAEHAKDSTAFDLPFGVELPLPNLWGFQVTKFMVLEVLVALLLVATFVPLAHRLRDGKPPRGRRDNLLDLMILFIRNEMAWPAFGRREAARFLPLILTFFFFILLCNLMGLLPWLGSPTASINVTAPLAAVALLVGIGAGIRKAGPIGFWLGFCPPMDLPPLLRAMLVPLVLGLEITGMLIRYTVLAVRLLANMFGGHLVLAMMLGFIPAMVGSLLWYGVTPAAVFGGTAISLLELLVAFLQAYIFAFLAALFIGMAVHQH